MIQPFHVQKYSIKNKVQKIFVIICISTLCIMVRCVVAKCLSTDEWIRKVQYIQITEQVSILEDIMIIKIPYRSVSLRMVKMSWACLQSQYLGGRGSRSLSWRPDWLQSEFQAIQQGLCIETLSQRISQFIKQKWLR